jgi:hypothetical protein
MNNPLSINLASSSTINNGKEVDFYRNPTELFRWINYRRWEGAQKRALSCPDEVSTWIVSSDPNTNAIQWRHLPLHLCCMQSQIPYSFLETLVRLYPEATEMQDHDGRTPMHLACLNAGITENVAMLLLSYNAAAAVTLDRNNCTPLDLLKQSIASASSSAVTTDLNSSALMLQRMENFLTQIKQSVRLEEVKRVDQLHANVSSERVASQQIINRLEEELAKTKQALALMESDINNKEDLETNFEQKLIMITKENNELTEENKNLRQTIKDMKNTMATEKDEINRHDEIVQNVKDEYQKKIDELISEVKNSKAETSTAKSMVEALESQLKVKFTSEHANVQKISALESTLSEMMANRNHIESEYKSRIDNLQRENLRLKESNENTTKYNNSLQDKVKELNESLSNIVASQTILSTEQERALDAAETYARETLEAVNAERDRLVDFVDTQRRQMEHLFAEQLRVLETGINTGMQQRAVFEAERERSVATIQKMKHHFKEMEAAEIHRRQHEAAMRSSSKNPLAQLNLNPSSPAIRSPHSNDSAVGWTVNNNSSPSSNSSKPRTGSNNTGARFFQNTLQSTPSNLSRVLERRLVEFSGSEAEETDATYNDDEVDDESDYSVDDQSSSVQTPSVQTDEGNWGSMQNGRIAAGQRPTRSSNLSYSSVLVNRPSSITTGGNPMYSASLRKVSSPSSPISSQFAGLNDVNHSSNFVRRSTPTFDQRNENGSTRKHVQYTEF